MIFGEVGWDIPRIQNQRVRDLLIMSAHLDRAISTSSALLRPHRHRWVPVKGVVFATTYGCNQAGGAGLCSNQALVGNTTVYKIVHDVDFINGIPIKPGGKTVSLRPPAGGHAADGIPDKDGVSVPLIPSARCTTEAIDVGDIGADFRS